MSMPQYRASSGLREPSLRKSKFSAVPKSTNKPLGPQQAINQTWRDFLAPVVQPAFRVLPFDRIIQPSNPTQPNALLSEEYDQVAEDCRRSVSKIVEECRRVNLRYRDLDWDLDWDIKYERGHCLNCMGSELFPISKSSASGSEANVPKAVKRVHEIFEAPTFRRDVNGSDVKQGNHGDCWLMAALIAWGNTEEGKKCNCVAFDQDIGIYGFVFYRDGQWIHTIVDDKLCLKSPCWDSPSTQRDLLEQIDSEDIEKVYRKTYQTGSKALFFSQCKDQNETWVPLLEKAYAKAHGDYASLEGGWIGEGIEDLSGGVTTELLSSDILDLDAFWNDEMSQVNRQFLFGCSTGLLEHGYGERDGICEAHAYVVVDARRLRSGQRLVKLRNPWGETRKGLWEGPWSDGSKEWTAEAQEELKHTFGSDSVFWISYEDLVRKYTLFERTRLFRDLDWRCSQEWAIMSVPWKAEYIAKFHVTLTQESPVVILLAQPDRRYFEGLHGQYSFRLQFRLHHHDKPDAEDYVVRSHGNYFMKRSVSVDVPKLSAGRYTVHIKVTGQRDRDLPSIEDVVKAECKNRENNEKLAQVGHAYDLAYSKVWKDMSQIASSRSSDQSEHFGNGQVEKEDKESSDLIKECDRDSNVSKELADRNAGTVQINVGTERTPLPTIDEEPYDSQTKADQDLQDLPRAQKEGHLSLWLEQNPSHETNMSRHSLIEDVVKGTSIDSGVVGTIVDTGEYDSSGGSGRSVSLGSPTSPLSKGKTDVEDEKKPSPWNACCPVNIRVYSKDPTLQLYTIPVYKV